MNEWNDRPSSPDSAPEDGSYRISYTTPAGSGAGENSPGYTPPAPEPRPEAPGTKKERRGLKVLALVLCGAILGGSLGAGGVLLGLKALGQGQTEQGANVVLYGSSRGVQTEIVELEPGQTLTPAQVYAQNVNSTVGITTAITTNYWGYQTTSAASGSGFILSADGYILTNHHVIEDSSSITVALYDGSEYEAELVGYDESSDIAVLKVDAEGLTPVVLGSSDALQVGESVVAIGNPLGELTFTLTVGVVSALDRDITTSSGASRNLIQTDCAINSGNSGGALFNLYGEVVGITNAKYSSSSLGEASIDNIGFAIPMDDVKALVQSIIENGYVIKPYIGISVADVSTESQGYGLPQGAAVKAVTEGAPAAEAGLQLNDIITEVNGNPITGSADLVELVSASQPGDQLVLTVWRQNETLSLTVTVAETRQEALPETTASTQTLPQQQEQPYGSMPFDFEDFFGQFFP